MNPRQRGWEKHLNNDTQTLERCEVCESPTGDGNLAFHASGLRQLAFEGHESPTGDGNLLTLRVPMKMKRIEAVNRAVLPPPYSQEGRESSTGDGITKPVVAAGPFAEFEGQESSTGDGNNSLKMTGTGTASFAGREYSEGYGSQSMAFAAA